MLHRLCVLVLLMFFAMPMPHAAAAQAPAQLRIDHAWIRMAPPGAMMLAGYATLRNVGDSIIVVTGASSSDFADVSMHQSIDDHGVERMRAMGSVDIVPGASVSFAPGGKHFMLVQSRRELREGDRVMMKIHMQGANDFVAQFTVSETAPAE